jgi:hypothetical protein
VLLPVAHSVLSVFSQQVFQDNIIQHGVCQKTLQFGGLIFQWFEVVGVRNIHTAILGFELVKRCMAKAMLAAHLSCWHPGFLFFEHSHNLGVGKTDLSHLFAASKVEQTRYESQVSFGG